MEIETLYKYFKECTSVTTDSRNCPEGSMFIALKGDRFNGNAFARQALEEGCRYAVVDEPEYAAADEPRILLVDDCLKALQQLANYHRCAMKQLKVLGITGTNGKTTTKELIATVLQKKYKVLYTQGNLNNHIGVPLTLLRLTEEHEVAVVEMGANHPGEIRTLVNIVMPDAGLITNVGKAHLEGFGSFEGVKKTKGELYDFLDGRERNEAFVDAANPHLMEMQQERRLSPVFYAASPGTGAAFEGKLLSCSPFLSFEWTSNEGGGRVDTHLIGSYNLTNAMAAVAVGRTFGVSVVDVCDAIGGYVPTNNRSQLTETPFNQLVVDAYNANPTSMMAAIENFRLMEVPHKIVLLGDMKELGEGSREEHRKVVEHLRQCDFERIVLVGPEFAEVHAEFEHYPDMESLKNVLSENRPEGCYILIKGSNSMKMHRLVDVL